MIEVSLRDEHTSRTSFKTIRASTSAIRSLCKGRCIVTQDVLPGIRFLNYQTLIRTPPKAYSTRFGILGPKFQRLQDDGRCRGLTDQVFENNDGAGLLERLGPIFPGGVGWQFGIRDTELGTSPVIL